jgi:Flp pilus assembly CpaF family ATPase
MFVQIRLLNVLSSFIPEGKRIVTIEDSKESYQAPRRSREDSG